MGKTKPFNISKKEVWRAYESVKAKKGSAGIDEQTIEDFEKDLKKNLYKIWNRMSSGTYFPPAVLRCDIPKKDGSMRTLGIPTVSDRIAQTVVKMKLESIVDPVFHKDSYGYRPKKSALQAVETAKVRCWRYNWVVDLDIKGFFDNIDHELMMKAVRHHTTCSWVILYIERWLKSSFQSKDGTSVKRERGTPQGGVVSPVLANLYLHHVFDSWMVRNFPEVPFERFADDAVIHCKNLKEAQTIKREVGKRMQECFLELHPEKTKIVYCADAKRNWGKGFPTSFDFLGFTFKRRTARSRNGGLYDGYLPGMSKDARKKISKTIRAWSIGRRSDLSLEDMSKDLNPIIRGWVNYYGRYYKRSFNPIRKQFHLALTRWARRKYKKFNNQRKPASKWVYEVARRNPELFAFWSAFYD